MITQFDKACKSPLLWHLADFYWHRLFALINAGIVLDLIKNEIDLLTFVAHNSLLYGHRVCRGIVIWWRLASIFIVLCEKEEKLIFSQVKRREK